KERRQQPQRGRLARAIRAEKAVDFSRLGAKRHIVDRANLPAFFIAEELGKVFGFDHGVSGFVGRYACSLAMWEGPYAATDTRFLRVLRCVRRQNHKLIFSRNSCA